MKCRVRGVLQCSSVEAAVQQRPKGGPCRVAGGVHVIARALVRLQATREPFSQSRRTVQNRIGEDLPQSCRDELPKATTSLRAIRCAERVPRVFERKIVRTLRVTEYEAVAAPGPVLCSVSAPGGNWIECKIPEDGPCVGAVLDNPTAESSLQDVPDATMSPVEALAVGGVQLLEQQRDAMLIRNEE